MEGITRSLEIFIYCNEKQNICTLCLFMGAFNYQLKELTTNTILEYVCKGL